MNLISKVNFVLDKKQKKQFFILGIMIFIGGFLETVGISALIPMITGVMAPDELLSFIERNTVLANIYDFIGITETGQLVTILLVGIILIFIIKNLFALLIVYVQSSFISMSKAKMTSRVLREFLRRPYEDYLGADIPIIFRLVGVDIPKSFTLIMAVLQLANEVVVSLLLFVLLVIYNWQFTLFLMVLFGGVTLFFLKFLRPVINRIGQRNHDAEAQISRWRHYTVYGLKEIKVLNREDFFVNNYYENGKIGAQTMRSYNVLHMSPRMLVETVFIIGVFSFILLFMVGVDTGESLTTTLAIFGVVAIRMLPSFMRMNTYFSDIAFNRPAFDYLHESLSETMKSDAHLVEKKDKEKSANFILQNEIVLNNISYAYPGTTKQIFSDANLKIPKGKSVGIIGVSGSGKSTLVDILLGLLQTQTGTITCDGRNIFDNYESWLSQIGYIPQAFYLIDESIRDNVAFGIKPDEIDDERVWEVLREAQLDDFIKELPEGLETCIGERGIRLSGGQRQRIGIARALYHNPEILVFDEATSALDNETEQAVMDAINNFYGRKTMIIIAHRLNTIAKCDYVYRVVDGRLEETTI